MGVVTSRDTLQISRPTNHISGITEARIVKFLTNVSYIYQTFTFTSVTKSIT